MYIVPVVLIMMLSGGGDQQGGGGGGGGGQWTKVKGHQKGEGHSKTTWYFELFNENEKLYRLK